MQESIFDLFGSHHRPTVSQKQNSRQATSVSSSIHSLGKGLAVPSNFKQKSLSVGGLTPAKRALGDVGNRLQQPRPQVGKEESQKPTSFSYVQKSPLFLPNGSKTPAQKSFQNSQPGFKDLPPKLKNVTETNNKPTLQTEVECKSAVDLNDLDLPEIYPDPDITKIDDDYEDLFPKSERLTTEDICRFLNHFVKAEKPKELVMEPDLIPLVPVVDVSVEEMQPLEVDLLSGFADACLQVPFPDLLWDI